MSIVKFLTTFFTIFLLTLPLSADDFSVGVSYGIFKIRLKLKSLLILVLGSATSTYSVMIIVKFIFTSMPDSITHWASSIILGGIGIKMLYNGWKEKEDYLKFPEKPVISSHASKSVSLWETYLVGLGLGVDDFAQAVGLSLAGFPIVLTVLLLELSEALAILTGNYLALKGISKRINGKLSIIPGIMLLLIALYQILF